MTSYIKEFLIEINQYPRYGNDLELFTIKDYFNYDSNTREYGYRDVVIPVSFLLNKEELPNEETIRSIINEKTPVMRRMIDLNNKKESWIFDTNVLKETKK
jgi:hypothetical protein